MVAEAIAPNDLEDIMARHQADRTAGSTNVMKFSEDGPEPLTGHIRNEYNVASGAMKPHIDVGLDAKMEV